MSTATSRLNGATAATEERPSSESGLLERVVEATRYSVRDIEVMAKKAAQSRLFGMDEAQAFTLMMLCEAEGIHPIQALRRFDIIDGRPTLKAATIQAEFQHHGGRLEWGETTAEVCEATFSHPALHPKPIPIRITLQELIDSGVALGRWDERTKRRELKANYQRHPRSMLRARVISEGVRAIDPGIVVGLYTPEEVSDFDDHPTASAPRPDPTPEPAPPAEPAVPPSRRVIRATDRTHSEPIRPISDGRRWMQDELTHKWDEWVGICLIEKADPGKRISINHALNHLVKKWADEGAIEESDYKDADGKQDNDRVAEIVREAWSQEQADVKADFLAFLRDDIRGRAAERGIEMQDEPDGDPIDPAEMEPADDTWQEGRE